MKQVKFAFQAMHAIREVKMSIPLWLEQINEKTVPMRLYAMVGSMYIQEKTTGVVVSIRMNFIDVAYWVCDWVEKRSRVIQENVQKGIQVGFVQFVKINGLE